jgi:hypothetical protein
MIETKEIGYKVLTDEEPKTLWQLINSLLQPDRRSYLAAFDFGMVMGSIWAVVIALFTLMAMNGKARLITDFFEMLFPGYDIPSSPLAFDVLINLGIGVIMGSVYGFLFGLLAAVIYNRLRGASLCNVKLEEDLPQGQIAILVEKGNTNPRARHKESFTVLIVANPFLEANEVAPEYETDPIVSEPNLFQAKVECILDSLRQSEVVKQFIQDIRFVAIFDPDKANTDDLDKQRQRALCFKDPLDVIIEPRQRIYQQQENGKYKVIEERLNNFLEIYKPELERVDIVYAVTASTTHTRSSALYTVDLESSTAKKFRITAREKNRNVVFDFDGYHEPRCEVPGMIAYSAWDNRLKTPLHEFAHAMSSTDNGLIVDEYHDREMIRTTDRLVINKRHATDQTDENGNGRIEPSELPPIFVEYREDGDRSTSFLTDLERLQPEYWRSFVPQRRYARIPCTMDRSGDLCEFDRMLAFFMEKRLQTKVQSF